MAVTLVSGRPVYAACSDNSMLRTIATPRAFDCFNSKTPSGQEVNNHQPLPLTSKSCLGQHQAIYPNCFGYPFWDPRSGYLEVVDIW